jgi:uncharacterized protein (DUF58 family)
LNAVEPDVLSRLRHLRLVATRTVNGFMAGAHRARRLGANVEFAEFKDYTPGDPLRDLDWKVLGKTDRLVTRRYQAETELACHLVLDASGDLGTGSQAVHSRPPLKGSKFGYALCLTATLAAYLERHGEPVGLHIVAGEGAGHRVIPARTGKRHLAQIFLALASLQPAGQADLAGTLVPIANQARRRSLVIVVSDFMEEPALWLPSVRGFGGRKTDFVALHLADRKELSLDFQTPAVFLSPEDGTSLAVDPVGAAPEFQEVVASFLKEVRGGIRKEGGRHILAWTDEPMDSPLRRLIGGQS